MVLKREKTERTLFTGSTNSARMSNILVPPGKRRRNGKMKTIKNGKIVIIGAGHVGSHCGLSLMMQGLADEIVYIDIDKNKSGNAGI